MSGSGTVKAFAGTVKAKYFKPTKGVDLPGASLVQTDEDVILDNTSATGSTIVRLGTDTAATDFQVQGNSEQDILTAYATSATAGAVKCSDNTVFGVGDDMDLRFQHDGTNSQITVMTGVAQCASDGDAFALSQPSPMMSDMPSSYCTFMDDFTSALHSDWVLTSTLGTATTSVSDKPNGVLVLSTGAGTDNHAGQLQHAQTSWLPAVNKSIWFETRFRLMSTVDNVDLVIGLWEPEELGDDAEGRPQPAKGLCFVKGSPSVSILVASWTTDGSGDVSAASTIPVIEQWKRVGFHFQGGANATSGTLTPYFDGVAGAALTDVSYNIAAEMAAGIMIRNNGPSQGTIEIDYIRVVQER